MPNIETPEEFAAKLSDRQHTALYITSLVVLRDAAIRSESVALLKTCGEALGAMAEPGTVSWGEIKKRSQAALAALREAGVLK